MRSAAEYLVAVRVAEARACRRGLQPPRTACGAGAEAFAAAVLGDERVASTRATLLAEAAALTAEGVAARDLRGFRRDLLLASLRLEPLEAAPPSPAVVAANAVLGAPVAPPVWPPSLATHCRRLHELYTTETPFVTGSGAHLFFSDGLLHVCESAMAAPVALPPTPCGLRAEDASDRLGASCAEVVSSLHELLASGRLGSRGLFIVGATQQPAASRFQRDAITYPPELFSSTLTYYLSEEIDQQESLQDAETAGIRAGLEIGRAMNQNMRGAMASWDAGRGGRVYLFGVVPAIQSLVLAFEIRLFLSSEASACRYLQQDRRALGVDVHSRGESRVQVCKASPECACIRVRESWVESGW